MPIVKYLKSNINNVLMELSLTDNVSTNDGLKPKDPCFRILQ